MSWELFGYLDDGTKIYKKVLENQYIRVELMNYGATILSFYVKDRDRYIDLGFNTLDEYVKNSGQLGATVGRVANRMANASYQWNGEVVQLEPNNGPNLLHSGKGNIGKRVWTILDELSSNALDLTMSITTRKEDDGFPGNCTITLHAFLVDSSLQLEYKYVTSEDSFVNLTNHIYFNLEGSGTIENHRLQLHCNDFIPFKEHQIPTGISMPVKDTPFDFLDSKPMGYMLEVFEEELAPYRGYDHDFVKNTESDAVGYIEVDDLGLRVYSNLPHVQLYTGNWLAMKGRDADYEKWSGMCLEPQFMPDDMNQNKLSYTKANKEYTASIRYEVVL